MIDKNKEAIRDDILTILDQLVCRDQFGRITDRILSFTFDMEFYKTLLPNYAEDEIYQMFIVMHQKYLIDLDDCIINGYPDTLKLRLEGINYYRCNIDKSMISIKSNG